MLHGPGQYRRLPNRLKPALYYSSSLHTLDISRLLFCSVSDHRYFRTDFVAPSQQLCGLVSLSTLHHLVYETAHNDEPFCLVGRHLDSRYIILESLIPSNSQHNPFVRSWKSQRIDNLLLHDILSKEYNFNA